MISKKFGSLQNSLNDFKKKLEQSLKNMEIEICILNFWTDFEILWKTGLAACFQPTRRGKRAGDIFSAFFSPPGAQTPALQSIDGKGKLCVLGTSIMVFFQIPSILGKVTWKFVSRNSLLSQFLHRSLPRGFARFESEI